MLPKNVPRVLAHTGALAYGYFQGLHGGKTFEDLAHAQPGHEQKGQEQNDATSENVWAPRAAQNQQQGQDAEFGCETENSAAGSGEENSDNGEERKNGDCKPPLAAHLAEN